MNGSDRRRRKNSVEPAWKSWIVAIAVVVPAVPDVAAGEPVFQQYRGLSHAVEIETRDSANARMSAVRVRQIDGEVAVTGYVEKRFYRGGPIPGRVTITAIGLDGNVIKTTETGYSRRTANSGRAYFSKTLPLDPKELSGVRVTHSGIGG